MARSSRCQGKATAEPLAAFEQSLGELIEQATPFATEDREPDPLAETWNELQKVCDETSADIDALAGEIARRATEWDRQGNGAERDNATLQPATQRLHETAERCRSLTKQIDLATKLAGRAVDVAHKELSAGSSDCWPRTEINRLRKAMENARRDAAEQLRGTPYFVRQADWLQERFPDAVLRDVEGLVRLVLRHEIETHDWSLTPGRYVGMAPEKEDEDFDFEEALRAIHVELAGLNDEAAELAAKIARNFEELGA